MIFLAILTSNYAEASSFPRFMSSVQNIGPHIDRRVVFDRTGKVSDLGVEKYTVNSSLEENGSKVFNEALRFFLNKTDSQFICIASPVISFKKSGVLRGSNTLTEDFIESFSTNKLPCQAIYNNYDFITSNNAIYSDDYVYHHRSTVNSPCTFVTRKAVEAVGGIDSNNCIHIWKSRIAVASGRYPEEYIHLRHTFRFVQNMVYPITKCPHELSAATVVNSKDNIKNVKKYYERMAEIYKGINLNNPL